MDRVFTITFESSVTNLCEVNSSFDAGVLRIAYAGQNRNGSYISKEAFERAMPSIYNVPVVTHYNREEDSLGGHDMEIVRDAEGNLELINLTTPVGVVPESAKFWWDTVEEEDGGEHEYLYTEVLLWKRQEGYQKIRDDGVVSQSMEITVKDGEMVDGTYYINDFEFTAFALIGVEPCFESAGLEMFSAKEFKARMNAMMEDLRQTFTQVTPVQDSSGADDDIHPHLIQTEGGRTKLEENIETTVEMAEDAVEETEPEVEPAEVEHEEVESEEVEAEVETEAAEEEPAPEEAEEPAPEAEEAPAGEEEQFELTGNIRESIERALGAVKVMHEWGECFRYWFIDFDMEKSEVYAEDTEDWRIYGMPYSMDGDEAVIDFENRSLKKWAIVDFEGGDEPDPLQEVFAKISKDASHCEELSYRIENMTAELNTLREFKANTESDLADKARDEIFAQFPELEDNEAFVSLKANASEFDLTELEEKCFAIRGRTSAPAKIERETKSPKLKVERKIVTDEPYGDLFAKYGNK